MATPIKWTAMYARLNVALVLDDRTRYEGRVLRFISPDKFGGERVMLDRAGNGGPAIVERNTVKQIIRIDPPVAERKRLGLVQAE